MSAKGKFYRSVKKALCLQGVNPVIKSLPNPIMNFILGKFVSAIPILGKVPVELPDGHCFFLQSDGNDPLLNFIFWRGFSGFEAETTSLFTKFTQRSDFIFDSGSHIGYYALLAATVNTKSKVFAFEPVPRVYNQLTRNVELNGYSNIVCISGAVTNFDGIVPLYVSKGEPFPCDASTLKGFCESTEEIKVPALTLDSFVRETNIPKVDLMKIDTEATEHIVLEGARHIIERDEPIIICEVLKGRTEKFLQSFFDNFGGCRYKYYWITQQGLVQKDVIEGDETYHCRNYLFVTENQFKENAWIEEWIIR